MYDFFKNIAEKSSCSMMGVCSIHPSINALYLIILNEIREISSYLVKLNEFKINDKEAEKLAMEGLSIFLINTSYSQKNYLEFLNNLINTKARVKEKYVNYCTQNNLPCELIQNNFECTNKMSISELINYSQNIFINKQKNINKTKQRLFELITLFSRLCAIEAIKIKNLNKDFNEFDFEILRFFALTNSYSIRVEKIKRRILEFCDFSLQIAKKLSSIYQQRYGFKETADTKTSLLEGHCILISGDDLNELEELLKAIEKNDSKEEISVYTHGPLFLAHFYPYFKKNPILKGHFGSNDAEYDFSVFGGSILITQNFIQKIDSLYRGEIFSNKLISFSKVVDIKNNDYTPVVKASLSLEKCKQEKESKSIKVLYDREKIKNFIETTDAEEIIAISGILDENQKPKTLENKKIVQINCPLEGDILIDSIEKLKEKNIKITVFLSECNLSNLGVMLMLLNQDINLNIANCPHALINPHVIESLKEDFNVNII